MSFFAFETFYWSLHIDTNTFQADSRYSYVNGGPGNIVSGLVWLAAGIMAAQTDLKAGFAVLFFGGMLIFPISYVIVRFVFKRPEPKPGNPSGRIVMETIFPMIGGLLGAWLILPYRPEFVFPLAAIAVGAHFFGFMTAYGNWMFWGLGAVICIVGVASIFWGVLKSDAVPFVVAGIELAFGTALTFTGLKQRREEEMN
ncbi:MAG: hypothetical protein R3C03_07590 [Pirellulaceae bacterium]